MHSSDSRETDLILHELELGDDMALERLLALHRDYMKHVVELRLEPSLRGRVDPSDVVQETQLVVADRIDNFLAQLVKSIKFPSPRANDPRAQPGQRPPDTCVANLGCIRGVKA